MGDVESIVDAVEAFSLALGPVVVADGVQQEILEAPFLKHLTKDVEDTAIEGFVDGFQLSEQAVIDRPFAGLLGDEVPEMTDLLLADAVNAPEALFEAVRVPRQVIIDHQVGVLEVDAFASGISCEEDADFGVGTEQGLALAAFITMHAAMDGGDGVGRTKDAGDSALQIVQSVAVLGEEDHLALAAIGVAHVGIVLKDSREFIPLTVQS